jgi:hypothetical protein
MRFTLEIKMDNAAFEDDPSYEVARILKETAKRIEGHPHFSPGHEQPLHDVNGNTVGCFDVWAD